MLESAKSRQNMICILSDDTDVFVLLAYWMNLADLQCNVQIEAWMDQYMTPMPPVLILVRNACSY